MKKIKTLLKIDKVLIIGEISGNHLNNFEIVKKLIVNAKKNGFDAIKIQTFTPEAMTIKSDNKIFKIRKGLWKNKFMWDLYQKSSMRFELQKKIFNFCDKIKMICFSSPFDILSVNFLEKIHCPIYKLASPEINHYPLIKRISKTKKPLIISTGMASLEEIRSTFNFSKKNGIRDLILLYCVSNYPAKLSDFNMNNIEILKKNFRCRVGFSDHSEDFDVAKSAVMMGATIIEKHISIDKNTGIDSKFSLIIKDFKRFRNEIDKVYSLKGKNFFYRSKSELENRIYRRSIFAKKDIKKNEKFNEGNVNVVRPANGLNPKFYYDLLKITSPYEVKKNDPIKKNILKKNNKNKK